MPSATSLAVRFGDGRTGLDPLDGIDVASPFGLSIAGALDGAPFAIVALDDLVAGPGATIPLVVSLPARRSYELEVVSAPDMVGNRPVRIEILDDGASTSIADGTPFTFTATGAVTDLALRISLGTAVDNDDESLVVPALAVYPNPSGGVATVALEVVEAGPVRVAVYDALGREVAVLEDGVRPAGEARFALEGLAPGAYVIRAEGGAGLGLVRSLSIVR